MTSIEFPEARACSDKLFYQQYCEDRTVPESQSFWSAMATLTPQDSCFESSASTDWQTTKGTVRERTAFLFNNSLMSDITFVLTDPDGTQVRVPAHKLVLAIGSPVFEAMFYGELAEKTREIELPDTEPPYLLEFLRFLYCDKPELTTDNVFGVLYLAQKYIVPSLADKCWAFIDENTCVCLESDNAISGTLHPDMLYSLVRRETLHITKELELFQATKHWAETKLKHRDLEPSGEAVRNMLGEAITCIRFPTISPEDFARHVVPSSVLTSEEVADTHQYFYRVKAEQELKFSAKYRTWMMSNAKRLECCRSPVIRCQSHEHVSAPAKVRFRRRRLEQLKESLMVKVEPRNVHLIGVHILTSVKSSEIDAFVKVLDEDGRYLAAEGGRYQATAEAKVGDLDAYGIVVKFKNPVLIWRSGSFTVEITIEDYFSDQLYTFQTDLSRCVQVSGLSFHFEGVSRHIYKLLFYKLD